MLLTVNANRTLVVTIIFCIFLLYISYIFNTCLVSSIKRSFRHSNVSVHKDNQELTSDQDETQMILGSVVRIVSLTDMNDIRNSTNKYRVVNEQSVPVKRLPEVLIIGVKKCGTRALLEFIRLHPDVRAAGNEIHFFDRHFASGLNWYRKKMPATIEGQITLEKSPSYYITKEAPYRIKKMNQNTKLLVVVRNPITRAISDYTQASSKKKDMKKFEELAFVNGSYEIVDTNYGPIKISVYAKYLERWLRYFPLRNFLFVSGEQLISDVAEEMYRVQDFLGLKRLITEKHFYFNSTKGFPCLLKSEARSFPHCLGKTKGRNHPKIDIKALQRLQEFYSPFNQKFYLLTGINFGWN